MLFNVLTLFPEVFTPYLHTSIVGRGQQQGHITVGVQNIRDYATDKHHTTDDTPYGGGAGMVMKVEPIDQALAALQKTVPREQQHVIVLSARGRAFNQAIAHEYATAGKSLTLICGRYEGIDQRVVDHLADEELSIGPYVLAGGELAALVVIEAVARLIPGVLGNPDSLLEESHAEPYTTSDGGRPASRIEYPQYTKPEEYQGWKVPEILLSGNHEAIRKWREEQRKSSV